MHTRTVRRPGEPGTQKLTQKYGDKLIAVRYRYDVARKKRFKTIELIVAEEDWTPPPPHEEEDRQPNRTKEIRIPARVPLQIRYFEKELQQQLKAHGATWDPTQKLWYALETSVQELGLSDRIAK